MKKLIPFFANIALKILFCSVFLTFTDSRRCIHDKKFANFEVPQYKLSSFERKFRQNQRLSEAPLRIVLESSGLRGNAQQKDIIMQIMNLSVDFLSKRLKVMSHGRNTVLPQHLTMCHEFPVPSTHRSFGFAGDLVIYLTSSYEAEDYFAWATFCAQDPLSRRPIGGQVHWNVKSLSSDPNQFQALVDVAIHELTHVLAFHGSLYRQYKNGFGSTRSRSYNDVIKNLIIKGRRKMAIASPKVLEIAREYFNCPTVEGIDLEDEGGSGSVGSHWERGTLHNEIMGASNLPDEAYSSFTLALLEDSGWYKADYSYTEPLYFGKGAGCRFLTGGCTKNLFPGRDEYCTSGERNLCTLTLKAQGYCEPDSFSDGCAFVKGFSNGQCEIPNQRNNPSTRGEFFGKDSRCVIGNVVRGSLRIGQDSTGICYRYTCDADGRTIRFHIQGGSDIVCNTPGEVVQAQSPFSGGIVCPKPDLYCNPAYKSCENLCSKKGYCNSGVCECMEGWGGKDCSQRGGPQNSRNPSSSTPITSTTSEDPCLTVTCPKNSNCVSGSCICNSGYSGTRCTKPCPNDCSKQGTCSDDGICTCSSGFSGEDCSREIITDEVTPTGGSCSNNCNDRGLCYNGNCLCLSGFRGQSCETADPGYDGSCPKLCHDDLERGNCRLNVVGDANTYRCVCKPGFLAPDCRSPPAPTNSLCRYNCGNKGSCRGGVCHCQVWYKGADCSEAGCLNWCNGKGRCLRRSQMTVTNGNVNYSHSYSCRCNDGTTGDFCS